MASISNFSLTDIFSIDSTSIEAAKSDVIEIIKPRGGGFNYLRAIKGVRDSYKGLHDINSLLAHNLNDKIKPGFLANQSLIEAAAPLAFGRNSQVFDIKSRKIPFGARFASYRIPFFFSESGIIRAYMIQPRHHSPLKQDGVAGVITVVKKTLLETEFYGERTDVEFVDASVGLSGRTIKVHSVAECQLWAEDRINDHFSIVQNAMDLVESMGLPKRPRPPLREQTMQLFD